MRSTSISTVLPSRLDWLGTRYSRSLSDTARACPARWRDEVVASDTDCDDVRTRNGSHVYCRYRADLKTTSNYRSELFGEKSVDIRNDGGLILAPPSRYVLGEQMFHYETDLSVAQFAEYVRKVLDRTIPDKFVHLTLEASPPQTPPESPKPAAVVAAVVVNRSSEQEHAVILQLSRCIESKLRIERFNSDLHFETVFAIKTYVFRSNDTFF